MSSLPKARTIALPGVAVALVLGLFGGAAPGDASAGAANQYIGASKCKNCHRAEETGNQYGKWESEKHAHAYENLGSDEAKAAGAERGVENPQEAAECLKCHVTAYGEPDDAIKRGFKIEQGVQCETCHGPGDAHMKARMKAAAAGDKDAKPEAGEIIASPSRELCVKCHNEESPSYKPFCYCKFMAQIRHLNPSKERTPEQLAELTACPCPDGCECRQDCCKEGPCSALPTGANGGK